MPGNTTEAVSTTDSAISTAITTEVNTVLIALSAVLTASVVFPGITGPQMLGMILGCLAAAAGLGGWTLIRSLRAASPAQVNRRDRENWRMPPLTMLSKPVMSAGRKVTLTVLGSYMAIAMILVIVRIIQMALAS